MPKKLETGVIQASGGDVERQNTVETARNRVSCWQINPKGYCQLADANATTLTTVKDCTFELLGDIDSAIFQVPNSVSS